MFFYFMISEKNVYLGQKNARDLIYFLFVNKKRYYLNYHCYNLRFLINRIVVFLVDVGHKGVGRGIQEPTHTCSSNNNK